MLRMLARPNPLHIDEEILGCVGDGGVVAVDDGGEGQHVVVAVKDHGVGGHALKQMSIINTLWMLF